jgi:hypothetical protein
MRELEAAFRAACGRYDGSNFESLSEVDRILVTIWGLEADMNNGGFNQYYFNGAGDEAFFAPEALRRIGALRMAEIVSRANAVFGPDGPSRDRDVRQAQLSLVDPEGADQHPWDDLDREFYAYPDDIATLLTNFLGRSAT